MPQIQRATLPQEFFDVYSNRLLLTPDPQYLHAKLWKNALSVSFSGNSGGLGFMPGRQFGTNGAPYQTNVEDGRLEMAMAISSQAISLVPEIGEKLGHTISMNRPVFTDSSYGQDDREIKAGSTISQTPLAVTGEQVKITVKRFGGPHGGSGSEVRPLGIDRFDGDVMKHRPAQIVGLHLKRDFDKWVDTVVVNLFENFSTTVRPTGMANDNTPTAVGSHPMELAVLRSAERQLDEANIPYFGDGKRMCVMTPLQAEQLMDDSTYQRLSEFHKDMNELYQGCYIGSVGTWNLFKSNTLLKVDNSSSIAVQHAQAFGPGAVGSGVSELPRVAYHTNDNYGETAYVIWLMYGGFAMMDNRFGASIRTA